MNEHIKVLADDLARAEVDLKRTAVYGPHDTDYQLARDVYERTKAQLARVAHDSLPVFANSKTTNIASTQLQTPSDTDLIGGTERPEMDASICGLSPYLYDLILIDTDKPMFALVRELHTGLIKKVSY